MEFEIVLLLKLFSNWACNKIPLLGEKSASKYGRFPETSESQTPCKSFKSPKADFSTELGLY